MTDALCDYIDAVCALTETYHRTHAELTEVRAMEGLATIIGTWIALYHEHQWRTERHHTVQAFEHVLRASMEDTWDHITARQAGKEETTSPQNP